MAVIDGKKSSKSISFNSMLMLILALVAVIGGTVSTVASNKSEETRLAPLVLEIKKSGKPRLIEIYATWCGPCRQYGPVLEEAEAKWGERINFQRFDADKPDGAAMADTLKVSAIPRTVIFDREGKKVFDREGVVAPQELEQTLSILGR